MARPKREIVMARCAGSALLAAIEIYNKPTVEYREQTVALLMVNAWEILAKAKLVQQSGGRIEAVYRRKNDSRHFERDSETQEPLSLTLSEVLNRLDLPQEAKANIRGLAQVRNRAAHLGLLTSEAQRMILAYGTASVQNFLKLSDEWFGEVPPLPPLLPVGFLGDVPAAKAATPFGQRNLLKFLQQLAEETVSGTSDCAVTMHVHIEVNRGFSGGGSIGLTGDPAAPRVRMSDDEALARFPATYGDLVSECKKRYRNFKQNRNFHGLMKDINADPQCTYMRKLDPTRESSKTCKRFYHYESVFEVLDDSYEVKP